MIDNMIIYLINLDRRPDRLLQCQENATSVGFPFEKIKRVSACDMPEYGGLGCARSHIDAITKFITCTESKYALILEDDFDFDIKYSEFCEKLRRVEASGLSWDVVMLGGNNHVAFDQGDLPVTRIFEAECTEGYIISRHYAAKLLSCFAQSAMALEQHANVQPRHFCYVRLAIDQAWKALQRVDNWYIFLPFAGRQRVSPSDCDPARTAALQM